MNAIVTKLSQARLSTPWARARVTLGAPALHHVARGLAAIALVAAALPVAARADYGRDDAPRGSNAHATVNGNLVDVQVRVDGRSAPLYYKPGAWDRHYVQAFKGRNYAISLHNTTGQRVAVLIAVDGLNVVNGEKSGLDRHEPMYVLDPWESTVIQGWRTSLDDVRRFVFVDEERSYAERTGQANGDMGWIRVLTFRENQPWGGWWNQPRLREPRRTDRDGEGARRELGFAPRAAAPAPSAPPMAGTPEAAPKDRAENKARLMSPESDAYRGGPVALEANPGTGWGDHQHDAVAQTQFDPERSPSDQILLRYEYASGLSALGIYPRRARIWDRESGQLGFAQPPRW